MGSYGSTDKKKDDAPDAPAATEEEICTLVNGVCPGSADDDNADNTTSKIPDPSADYWYDDFSWNQTLYDAFKCAQHPTYPNFSNEMAPDTVRACGTDNLTEADFQALGLTDGDGQGFLEFAKKASHNGVMYNEVIKAAKSALDTDAPKVDSTPASKMTSASKIPDPKTDLLWHTKFSWNQKLTDAFKCAQDDILPMYVSNNSDYIRDTCAGKLDAADFAALGLADDDAQGFVEFLEIVGKKSAGGQFNLVIESAEAALM